MAGNAHPINKSGNVNTAQVLRAADGAAVPGSGNTMGSQSPSGGQDSSGGSGSGVISAANGHAIPGSGNTK